jgi:hypothetical protein
MQAMQQQQKSSFDGQAWQQTGTTTNGSAAPQTNIPAQSPALQPGQLPQSTQGPAKGDLVGAVRAFMAARGTPLPPNMATSFVGPSGTASTEPKSIEMQTLFATVVQFGGSARVGAQQNGWAIVASKLGLAVAPIPPNHIAGQNEVDSNGLPLPAFVAPRLCQFFKDRFTSFEEFWMAKMKGAGGQAAAAAYVATNGASQPSQAAQQPGEGLQQPSMEMQGQTSNAQQATNMPNGSMQQSGQGVPATATPQMMPQQQAQPMQGQGLLGGAASVNEAAQKANQLQAQLPRQMQQLQELINSGKMTQQQARDRYMYLQNAAKMAMLQAQALAQAHAAAQASGSQSQQSAMMGQQFSQPGMPPTDIQQPTPTLEAKKGPKKTRKTTAGSAKSANSSDAAATQQANATQLNMQAQQAARMLQQGNLNPALQVGAFATIRTAQLASQGITGADVTGISQTMAQIYSSILAQAQTAGQPIHIAAPLAFNAAQQEASKSTSLQQQDQQNSRQPSPYAPLPSRPSSEAGPSAAQLQIPLQAPTKPGKFKVEYLPIRRDVHSHGGWDLDVVERQMGDYIDGKGRFPRSVRELGHVDVESLIMSLRSRLEVEVTYSLNALFILTAGVQAPGFHLLLSLCEDLCDELLEILEEAAFGTLFEEKDHYIDEEESAADMNGIDESESPLSYAEWVTGIMEEEDSLRISEQRGRKRLKRTDSNDQQAERINLRCSQVAISILEIFRNLATIEDNHLFLNNEPRFMRLLMEIIQSLEHEQRQRREERRRSREGGLAIINGKSESKGRSTIFTSLEGLRLRKDVLCIIACLSGETCNLTRLDKSTVLSMFDLVASFIKDAGDIELEHGIVYGDASTGKAQPLLRRVPQHADMALEAFSSFAQPDVNRQLLGKIVDEEKLISLGANLVKLLPVSDVDFQLLKTEAILGYCERIAMSLFNIAFLGSKHVKKELRESVGAIGVIFRCVKRLIRVNSFQRNPFAVLSRRLIECLRMLDADNIDRPAFLGMGQGQGRESRDRHGLLLQDEISVVEMMTLDGVESVIISELEQLL